jgi:hypothetical protein
MFSLDTGEQLGNFYQSPLAGLGLGCHCQGAVTVEAVAQVAVYCSFTSDALATGSSSVATVLHA